MIEGGCLCARVRYCVDELEDDVSHCHCSMCRRMHGAAFGTYAGVKGDGFRWLQGEDLVKNYRSSPGVVRTFCSNCGSTLQFIAEGPPRRIELALGTVVGDPGVRPTHHIFTGSKAPWFDITDDLLQHEAHD